MKYETPEVVMFADAANAIQGGEKNSPVNIEADREPTPFSAYECDE